ncbi:MAG: cation:proton antiporter [Candidatus Thermoplasmatota archaeon]
MTELAGILLKLVVLLVGAKLAGELAERLRQPAVLGELLAGILLGPTLFGFMDFSVPGTTTTVLRFVAELGAILLLFEIGLETRLKEMMAVGASSLLVALLGIVGSFVAGFGISWLMGALGFWANGTIFHVFIGATFTATSVGITARVLSDLGKLATPEARIILGAAVLDDVGGLLILAVVASLATGTLDVMGVVTKGTIALAFLAVAVLVGIRLMPPVMDLIGRARVRGVVVASGISFALLLAFIAEEVGLAAIVGAFTAGIVLATTRQDAVLAERVKPIGDIFVPFFFVYVGLQVDLRGLGNDWQRLALAVGILTIAAIAGKLVAGFGVIERGLDRYGVGVGMVPRGEVGLIFALVGLTTMVDGEPLLEAWEYAAVLLVVAITTFITPVWLKRVLSRDRKAPGE